MRAHVLFVAAVALLGCQGKIGDTENPDVDSPDDPSNGPAFAVPDSQPQLLPFWVRLQRVADVLGKSEDDPLFTELVENRLALGDYDYASGVKADRMWSPARMTLWAKSLKPVCSSAEMHELYPALATDAGEVLAFASDAWGRDVLADELNFDAPTLASLDETSRYEMTCLAVLSSAEFVIQ
ncbi:MAG: hypothetical protein HOW73_17740 [Polyangiaceae bacterium]|nr:hypothetical protein [Polyangiaceae bacterium]